jgi:hypothetical protein
VFAEYLTNPEGRTQTEILKMMDIKDGFDKFVS